MKTLFQVRRLAAVIALLVVAWPALASAEKKRVGIPRFDGPQEALVRKKAMAAVKSNGYDVVSSRQMESAAQSLGVTLDSNDGFRAVAKELSISAFVTGEVSKKKAKLTVRNGSDGSVSAEEAFSGANPRKVAADVGRLFWRRLGSAIGRGRVPSGAKKPNQAAVAEAPEDKETDDEKAGDAIDSGTSGGDDDVAKAARVTKAPQPSEDEAAKDRETTVRSTRDDDRGSSSDESSSGGGGGGGDAVEVSLGARPFFRTLAYNQQNPRTPQLLEYKPRLMAGATFNGVVYPAAFFTNGFAANIGLDLGIEQTFGITSSTSTSVYPTTIHDYTLGARVRIPINEMIEARAFLGAGEHAFKLSSGTRPVDDRSMLPLPDTIYRYARVGAGIRLAATPQFSVFAGAAYRHILTPGQIKDRYYPHLTLAAMDANLGAAFKFTPMIEARAGADYRRYVYDMHSVAADTYQAGGAVDQYIAFNISVTVLLGGSGGGGGGGGGSDDDGASSDDGDGESDAKIKRKKKKRPIRSDEE